MSVAKFYLDADSASRALVRTLRAANLDVRTAKEVGLLAAQDDLQIQYVLASKRILVTGDHRLRQRMIDLTSQGVQHPGIAFLPNRWHSAIGAIVASLELIASVCSAEEMIDQVVFLPL